MKLSAHVADFAVSLQVTALALLRTYDRACSCAAPRWILVLRHIRLAPCVKAGLPCLLQ